MSLWAQAISKILVQILGMSACLGEVLVCWYIIYCNAFLWIQYALYDVCIDPKGGMALIVQNMRTNQRSVALLECLTIL